MPDYLSLITSEHRDKPKFAAMVLAVTDALSANYDLARSLPACFDLDNAIGAQLDVVGLWVGLSRNVSTPLAVYFSLDTADLGFDQGSWKGPFDPSDGITSLDDETYRLMLRAKIGANKWDGTIPGLQAILDQVFSGTGSNVFIVDNQDMSMDVYISGAIPSAILKSLLKNGYLSLKPSGVRVSTYTITTGDNTPLFGFDLQNQYVSGFDSGAWGAIL